ncbi:MAG: hypothetical protein Q9218_005392 [Villophora microphyllina]
MAAPGSKTASTVMRYRPAILAFTAIAAGIAVYAIQNNYLFSPTPAQNPKASSTTSLRRSNARRRRRSDRRSSIEEGSYMQYRVGPSRERARVSYPRVHDGRRVYGLYTDYSDTGKRGIWLKPDQLPPAEDIQVTFSLSMEDAAVIRKELENQLLISFFAQEMPSGPPIPLTLAAKQDFIAKFAETGSISADAVTAAIGMYELGELQNHVSRMGAWDHQEQPAPTQLWSPFSDRLPFGTPGDLSSVFQAISGLGAPDEQDNETVADSGSDKSYEPGEDSENKAPQDQNLMNLLYRIAEDQSIKEGFVHREARCNSCNMMPIRGIRYRCTNCHDYDLCEQCEALQVHDRTHLFYKIRIPAPFLGNSREPTPVWYPGKPENAARDLTTELKMTLSQNTGVEDKRLDAYWEQFKCIAASSYPKDPHGFRLAIDRRSFNQCFVPNSTLRQPPPNLVYDRMFSFYDSNDDGLIGFEEFLSGIACISNMAHGNFTKTFHQRVFQAYDVDGDGFVDRKDFLRMFKGFYALTKELTMQVVSGMDHEFFDEEDARDVIAGSQPLSSIFSGTIPPGQQSLSNWGKSLNRNGDRIVDDGMGVIRDDDAEIALRYGTAPVTPYAIIGSNAEVEQMGDLDPQLHGAFFARGTTNDLDDPRWPPRFVLPRDVGEALGSERLGPPGDVIDPIERCLVLCAVGERVHQDAWTRGYIRRRTMTNRWEARQFYLNSEMLRRPIINFSDGTESLDRVNFAEKDVSSYRANLLHCLSLGPHIEELRRRTRLELTEQWPEMQDCSHAIATLEAHIKSKQKWHDMARAIASRRTDIPKASVVVKGYIRNLHLADSLFQSRDDSPRSASPNFSPVEQRSRSSSNVRIDHGVDGGRENAPGGRSRASSTVSKSMPTGERWGDFDIPRPESDHGREAIYHIVQEGMNELLDPIFKLREDLALEVIKTTWQRTLYKDEISEWLRDGSFTANTLLVFVAYQCKWYKSPRSMDITGPSQAVTFVNFAFKALKKIKGGKYSRFLTSTNLQEATDAIVKLDQEVAHEVQGESSLSRQDLESSVRAAVDELQQDDPLSEDPAAPLDLQTGVTAFNEANAEELEQSSKHKPLELLLADAGYGVVTPPVPSPNAVTLTNQKDDIPDPTLPQNRPNNAASEESTLDPTLPQNRPNTIFEWELKHNRHFQRPIHSLLTGSKSREAPHRPPQGPCVNKPALSQEEIEKLALWTVIEEDDRKRGGAGRLSLEDFEMVMEGGKGAGLGFIGSWIESAAF